LWALFAKPQFANTNRTLSNMFNEAELLGGLNRETVFAAGEFKNEMLEFSKVVKERTFDEKGLSQGMPFVWKVLDPELDPFSVSI